MLLSHALLMAAVPVLVLALQTVTPPKGFTALYNGRDLTGWRGGDTYDHRKWLALPDAERATLDADWTADMRAHWRAEGPELALADRKFSLLIARLARTLAARQGQVAADQEAAVEAALRQWLEAAAKGNAATEGKAFVAELMAAALRS